MTPIPDNVINEARAAIQESSIDSKIYVGCDSKRYKNSAGDWMARYATVIILHYDGAKGCKLFHGIEKLPDYGTSKAPKLRLLNEVMFATKVVNQIIDVVEPRVWEIHADLNPNPRYLSHVAVKEALGYVRGVLGVDAKIKPDAFAAMHCADHLVRKSSTYA